MGQGDTQADGFYNRVSGEQGREWVSISRGIFPRPGQDTKGPGRRLVQWGLNKKRQLRKTRRWPATFSPCRITLKRAGPKRLKQNLRLIYNDRVYNEHVPSYASPWLSISVFVAYSTQHSPHNKSIHVLKIIRAVYSNAALNKPNPRAWLTFGWETT